MRRAAGLSAWFRNCACGKHYADSISFARRRGEQVESCFESALRKSEQSLHCCSYNFRRKLTRKLCFSWRILLSTNLSLRVSSVPESHRSTGYSATRPEKYGTLSFKVNYTVWRDSCKTDSVDNLKRRGTKAWGLCCGFFKIYSTQASIAQPKNKVNETIILEIPP